MRRIYVGGGSDERMTVRLFIERLVAKGWEVTHDWTRDPGYDSPPSDSQRKRSACLDLAAVEQADIVWILAPQSKSEGAAVEFGFARGRAKKTIVSGAESQRCIFWLQADRLFADHDDAMLWLGYPDPLDTWRTNAGTTVPTASTR